MSVVRSPALALGLLACSLAAGIAHAQTRWDLPTAYPAGNFHTENLQQFAAEVERASGGQLKISLHPDASLFKASEIKRAVQGGQAQIGEILLLNFENENPLFGVDGIPTLATGYAEARKLDAAQRPFLDRLLAAQGLQLLYTVAWPPQGIFSTRTLGSVAEMRGIRWRTYTPATARIAELIDARPVTIQAAELNRALASGLVESYMSSSVTGYDARTYESTRYFYDTQSWMPKNAVIVNRKALAALAPPVREVVLKAAAAAQTRGWQLSEARDRWHKRALAEQGMQVHKPSAKLAQDLRQLGSTLLGEWEKRAGPEGKALLSAYRR